MTTTAPAPTAGPKHAAAATAAVVVAVVAWASAFVVIRGIGDQVSPGPLALGRLAIGSLTLGALLMLRGRWQAPTAPEWRLIVLCGVTWFAVYNVAINAAERRVDAGTTAMLVNVGPILIALFAGALLGEGLSRWLLAGAGTAFAGTLLIGVATSQVAGIDLLGVVLSLLAAVAYAVGVLAQKPTLRRLPPLQVTWVACSIGAVACLPYGPGLLEQVAQASAGQRLGMAYLGLVPTALAFVTWAYALSRMDASKLGVTTYLVPPLTIAASWPLLGEVPPQLALAGGALCLVGVALSRRR